MRDGKSWETLNTSQKEEEQKSSQVNFPRDLVVVNLLIRQQQPAP